MKSFHGNNDVLKDYLNKGSIEKAPSGFTSRVMNNIRFQEKSYLTSCRKTREINVPLVSILIVAGFIITSFFIPEKKRSFSNNVFSEYSGSGS